MLFIIKGVKVANIWLSETNKSDLQDKIIDIYDYSSERELTSEHIADSIRCFFIHRGFTVKEMIDYLTCTGNKREMTLDEVKALQDMMIEQVIRNLELDINISLFE